MKLRGGNGNGHRTSGWRKAAKHIRPLPATSRTCQAVRRRHRLWRHTHALSAKPHPCTAPFCFFLSLSLVHSKLIIHYTAEKKRWVGERFPPLPRDFPDSLPGYPIPATFPDLPNVSVVPNGSFLSFLLFFLTKVQFFHWNAEKKSGMWLTFPWIWAIIRKSGKFSTLAGLLTWQLDCAEHSHH